MGAITNVLFNAKSIDNLGEGLILAAAGAASGALTALSGGVGLLAQIGIAAGSGIINSVTTNAVQQMGNSGGENGFDWGKLARAAISGAVTGAANATASGLINAGWISNALDKYNITDNMARNIVGNATEGAMMGLVAVSMNELGSQFIENGVNNKWDLSNLGSNILMGTLMGSLAGAANGVVTELVYQKELKDGISPLVNSDVASALGEGANSNASSLASTASRSLFGHDYGIRNMELPGSICIATVSRVCSISIEPSAPMVPKQPSYRY